MRDNSTSEQRRQRAEAALANGNYPPYILLEACSTCGADPGRPCWASKTIRGKRAARMLPHPRRVQLANLGRDLK